MVQKFEDAIYNACCHNNVLLFLATIFFYQSQIPEKFMFRILNFIFTLFIVFSLQTQAQFVITSSTPVDGEQEVQLSTIVSFNFSSPIDTNTRFGDLQLPINLLAHDPLDSITLGNVTYSGNLQTISIEVTHTANTDYVWIVIGARSLNGEMLAMPYVLNYTTSQEHGQFVVKGIVSYAGEVSGAFIALLDKPLFSDYGNARSSVVITNSTGEYTTYYLRDGTYWPVCAKDANGDGELDPFDDYIGFYDENNDGVQDSIVIQGDNRDGVNMTLRQLFYLTTATGFVDTAKTLASQYASDQQLRYVFAQSDGDTINLDGTSFGWMYMFFSPTLQFYTTVFASSFFMMVDTTNPPPFPQNSRPIPENFIDSDSAMWVVEHNGGEEFRQLYNVVSRRLFGGNFVWIYPQDTTKVVWVGEYEALLSDGTSLYFHAIIDIETGEFLAGGIDNVRENFTSTPNDFILYQNYPNPFNPTTNFRFQILDFRFVSLKVYDVLGKEIATLVNEKLAAGTYNIPWNANDIPSGVYFYRLQVGNNVRTQKMLLLK
ncbi:MAG: T9SS type A sorting domain-containing protein [Ignavibacteria bacterium]|nr:T9SS type A sorting domain-containing protein [Ignavibacteria bacterium]